MGDILSQSEIDSLIKALTVGELDEKQVAIPTVGKKIKEYKFLNPTKFAKDHINTIKIICDTYARLVTNFLQGYLRTAVQVEVSAVQPVTYFEFINSIGEPAVIAVIDFSPLNGSIILEIAPYIAFAIVDRILGGRGTVLEKLRDFTDIENAVLERIMNQMVNLLREPWENVVQLRPRLEKIENNVQFTRIFSDNESVALITFSARVGEVEGLLNLCIPHVVVEPIMPKLNAKLWFSRTEKGVPPEARENIKTKVEQTLVPVRAVLGRTSILVSDFLELQPGDVLTLNADINSDLDILVGNILKFHGKPGVRKNRLAVKISDVVREEE